MFDNKLTYSIEDDGTYVWYGDGDECAIVRDNLGTDQYAEDHARLFAAAPDLLAACERMLDNIAEFGTIIPETVDEMDTAVAKAKGETNS